jgi:putative ABC transport system ATP-binding protein
VPDLLTVEAVSKTWNRDGPAPVHAVREVSFSLPPGAAAVITGPSGSGKTTLLSMLGAILTPDGGRVLLDGVEVAAMPADARARVRLTRIGFVFQRGILLEELTARQNIALVPRAAGVTRSEAGERADAFLGRLGLADRAGFYAGALSPGEAQRVAVARALVMRPRLVLADEPTAHLDRTTGRRVVQELRSLTADCGGGLVIVTHDDALVEAGDRVFALEDGRLRAR